MKIHFNSIGIITNVQTDGDSLRQGSVGTALEATFEGINNNYYSAKLNFTRSNGSGISSVAMLWDSENTETFKFVFDDSWFFALSGTTTITVFLYDAKGKVIANGQYQFHIEPTDYNEEPTITINQFNALMTALAGKVGVPTSSVFVSELPEKGESGVFYVVREGENNNNIYVYNANTEDYVWVGTNDLKLDNYTTKEEQETFEKEIHSDIEKLRNQVINPFIVVDTTASLPTTEQGRLYVVVETGKWYYWDGIAYVEGGQFLNINEAKTLENGQGENSLQQKGNYAGGDNSFAIGVGSDAYGEGSFASGIHTFAVSRGQAVFGKYNKGSDDTIFEIGNGTEWEQRNAFEVYKDGHAEVQTIGTTDNSVTTKGYVDPQILEIKYALYGSILAVENQNYVNVGWGIFDRANGYPIVSNQKAQITSVKGRTLIANQLVKNGNFATNEEWKITSTEATATWGTKKLTITTMRAGGNWTAIHQYINGLRLNDKYYLKIKHTKSSNCALRLRYPQILTISDDIEYIITANEISEGSLFFQAQSTDGQEATLELTEIEFTNLTKEFGAGREPTTVAEYNNLTRNWLSGTFDAGTIKPTNFFQIIKKGFNVFDEEWEIGGINAQGVVNSNVYNARSKNYISVVSGQNYTISNGNYIRSGTTEIYVNEYDENYTSLRRTAIGNFSNVNTSKSIQLLNETKYIKFFIFIDGYNFTNNFPEKGNWCFHLTGDGSMNGIYKPHIEDRYVDVFDIDNIPTLQGIGTAQDEKTLTQDKIVIASVDLEMLNYAYQGDGLFNSTTPIEAVGTNTATPANLLCVKYESGSYYDVTNKSVDKQITFNKNNKLLYIMDRDYSDVATFKQSLSGQKLYFERLTPIILRKNYTAKVDLGSLNWGQSSSYPNRWGSSNALKNNPAKSVSSTTIPNLICEGYTADTYNNVYIGKNDLAIAISSEGLHIYLSNSGFQNYTPEQVKEALSGFILYYETAEEVSTPLPEIGLGEVIIDDVERLGTFNINGECIADFEFAHVAYKPAGE